MRGLFYWLVGSNTGANKLTAVSFGLLILRVSTGVMMAFGHGWGKLSGFSERAATFPDPLGVGSGLSLSLAVFAEFFCSIAVALGLFTRGAVIPLIITMAVAGFVIHGDDPFREQELAFIFLTVFATLFFTGAGKFSVDRLIGRK
jgi:putative oxidoreductase